MASEYGLLFVSDGEEEGEGEGKMEGAGEGRIGLCFDWGLMVS